MRRDHCISKNSHYEVEGLNKDQFDYIKKKFVENPAIITNNEYATYVLDDKDNSGGTSEGDQIDINISGPQNGSVRVAHTAESENRAELYFQTLLGHPDAGRIGFSLQYVEGEDGQGTMIFEINNMSRSAVMSGSKIATEAGRMYQIGQWKNVMTNMATATRSVCKKNGSIKASSEITIYQWNEVTNSLGDKVTTLNADNTSEIKKGVEELSGDDKLSQGKARQK
jgi:hypothetical protein